MSASDGERIAPVTYLFGAPRRQDAPEPSLSEAAPSPALSEAAPSAALSEVALSAASSPAAPAQTQPAPSRVAFRDEAERDEAENVQTAEREAKPGRFLPINNVSMNALARRGMSIEEMRAFLLGREFDSSEVEVEIERLTGVALLDDFALAETLVRTLRDRKGLGRSSVTAELRRRKLDQSAITSALDEIDDDELARATELAEKRAPQLRSLDAETAKRRLGGFLMRKGYSGSVVSTAVARALTPSGPVFR